MIYVGTKRLQTDFCLQLSSPGLEQLGSKTKTSHLPEHHSQQSTRGTWCSRELPASFLLCFPSGHKAAHPCTADILAHHCSSQGPCSAAQGQADGRKPHLQQEQGRKLANQATNAIRAMPLQLASPLTRVSRTHCLPGTCTLPSIHSLCDRNDSHHQES